MARLSRGKCRAKSGLKIRPELWLRQLGFDVKLTKEPPPRAVLARECQRELAPGGSEVLGRNGSPMQLGNAPGF